MNTNLTTFSFHNKPIRVVEIYGSPWFVVKDVLAVLGMPIKTATGHPISTTSYLAYLEADEKHTYTKKQSITEGLNLNDLFMGRGQWQITLISESGLYKLDSTEITPHPIGGQRGLPVNCISESGLYKLVMRFDKPEARTFQDWVTREVLPSIRRTDAYVTGQPSIQENPNMDPLDLLMAQAELLPKLITQLREQRAIQKVHEEKLAS